jgi:hypothetical protein
MHGKHKCIYTRKENARRSHLGGQTIQFNMSLTNMLKPKNVCLIPFFKLIKKKMIKEDAKKPHKKRELSH